MCGIVGYIGVREAAPILLEGLGKLEYRGYDSAGLAVFDGEKINVIKTKGKSKNLRAICRDGADLSGTAGIGHKMCIRDRMNTVTKAREYEEQVDYVEGELREKHIERLAANLCAPRSGVVFLDILSNLERISDHADNIAGYVKKEL